MPAVLRLGAVHRHPHTTAPARGGHGQAEPARDGEHGREVGDLYAPDASLLNEARPDWMSAGGKTGLLSSEDKNGDSRINYYNDKAERSSDCWSGGCRSWKGNEVGQPRASSCWPEKS
jgi:cation/acetate symporter